MRLYIFEDGMMIQYDGPISKADQFAADSNLLDIIECRNDDYLANGEIGNQFYCNGDKVPRAKNTEV